MKGILETMKKKGYVFICICIVMLNGCGKDFSKTDLGIEEGETSFIDSRDQKVEVNTEISLDNEAPKSDSLKETKADDEVFDESAKKSRETFIIEGEQITDADSVSAIPIYTVSDLESIADGAKEKYILMADIDCSELESIIERFQGVFEGNYHQLKNLKMPLFNNLDSGTINNLAIINSSSNTAGLVRLMMKGTISNCYVTGEIGARNNNKVHAGLIQEVCGSDCFISYSYNAATVYAGDGYEEVGGIIGTVLYNGPADRSSRVINCYQCENYGTIYVNGARRAGGICGYLDTRDYCGGNYCEYTIQQCFNYGSLLNINKSLFKTEDGIGGILGCISAYPKTTGSKVYITLSFNSNYGNFFVSDESLANNDSISIGGVLGKAQTLENFSDVYIFLTDNLNAGIANKESAAVCYSLDLKGGDISITRCIDISDSKHHVYGYYTSGINTSENISVENCYFLKREAGGASRDAAGLTEEEMQDINNFEGIYIYSDSFEEGEPDGWAINPDINNGYPYILNYDQNKEIIDEWAKKTPQP